MSNEKFLEYLDNLHDLIKFYESMQLSSEIMGNMPLTEEQVKLTNVFLEKLQKEWEDSFLTLLELGVESIKKNREKREDD